MPVLVGFIVCVRKISHKTDKSLLIHSNLYWGRPCRFFPDTVYLKSQWIVQFRIWQFNNIPALVAVLLRVAGVTADLAESNGSLPPGLWLTSPAGWLQRTWISSGTLCSVIEYGLPFYQLWQPQSMNSVSLYTIWSMSPALGRTTDLQRLCSVRNWRLSALLSAVGRLTASSPCVARGILLSRTTGVAAADKKTTTLTKFATSIVCPSKHRQASGSLNKLCTRANYSLNEQPVIDHRYLIVIAEQRPITT